MKSITILKILNTLRLTPKLSLVTKLGFHIVFLQIETYNPINLIIVDHWDKKAGQTVDRLKSQKLHLPLQIVI